MAVAVLRLYIGVRNIPIKMIRIIGGEISFHQFKHCSMYGTKPVKENVGLLAVALSKGETDMPS